MKLLANRLLQQITGFSFVGIIVTVFSIILLYISLKVLKMDVYIAYVVVYIISIAISYFLNGKIVFKKGLNVTTYLIYNLIYASSLALGLFILYVAEKNFNFDEFVNSIIPLPFTMIWNFLFAKKMFDKFST
jgi:putative flippase GtrA